MTTQATTPVADAGPHRASLIVALISGVFCLVVCGAMLAQLTRARLDDPMKSPQLKVMKEKLLAAPEDENLKKEIRALDLQLRQRYFRQVSLNGAGAWLALAGVVIFVLASKQVLRRYKQLPAPQLRHDGIEQDARAAEFGRWSVTVAGALVAGTILALALGVGTSLPKRQSDLAKLLPGTSVAGAVAADLPSPEEFQANWPRFRGPGGNGVSAKCDAPLTCDVKTGANIAWTAAVPAQGFSSPVVWGNRVFLSGGDAAKREVMCYDAQSGKLLWEKAVPKTAGSPAEPPEVPDQCGMAAATVATDGRRVYAMFANGDLAAFNFDGNIAWSKHLAVPKNPYGHATSLLTWQDRVIVQFDQGEPEDRLSKLYAFDGATGAVVWQQPRPAGASWATPIVFDAAGKSQVIALAVPWVIAYSAKDGTEIWRANCLDGEVTPSPVFAGSTLFIASPSLKLQAIRPDGQGDVTKTHLGWSAEDNIPDVTSPVSNGELVFIINSGGMLTCYDAKDGKKQWEHDFGDECNASPSIAGNRLYLITKKGTLAVVEVARQFKELGRSPLGEQVFASPAFAQNKIFVRGLKHLICIGAKDAAPAK